MAPVYMYVHSSRIKAATTTQRRRLQPTPAEDVLDRRVHVPARRKQGAHILRRVREPHVLQLLCADTRVRIVLDNIENEQRSHAPAVAPGTALPEADCPPALQALRALHRVHPVRPTHRTC